MERYKKKLDEGTNWKNLIVKYFDFETLEQEIADTVDGVFGPSYGEANVPKKKDIIKVLSGLCNEAIDNALGDDWE